MSFKGVSLTQKSNVGTYYVRFRDPKQNKKQVFLSTETQDGTEAQRIAQELSSCLTNPTIGSNPPNTFHKRTLKIWGVEPFINKAVRLVSTVGKPHGEPIPADRWEIIEAIKELHDTRIDRDQWRDRAIAAESMLQKMGKTAVNEIVHTPLKMAKERYEITPNGLTQVKGQWREIQIYWLAAFVKEFGENKNVFDVAAQDVLEYVNKSKAGNKNKKEMASCIRKFLMWATKKTFNAEPLNSWLKSLKLTKKDWFWLEASESRKLIRAIDKKYGRYWADVAVIQWAIGVRPEELPLLLCKNIKGDCESILIDSIYDDDGNAVRTLKTERSRGTIHIPGFAKDAFKRRKKAGGLTLFPYSKESGIKRIVELDTSFERMQKLWPSADDHGFSNNYILRLRGAAESIGLASWKKVNSRTFRATCGKDLLKAGKSITQVAAVLRDAPTTIEKHYAKLISADVSTER